MNPSGSCILAVTTSIKIKCACMFQEKKVEGATWDDTSPHFVGPPGKRWVDRRASKGVESQANSLMDSRVPWTWPTLRHARESFFTVPTFSSLYMTIIHLYWILKSGERIQKKKKLNPLTHYVNVPVSEHDHRKRE